MSSKSATYLARSGGPHFRILGLLLGTTSYKTGAKSIRSGVACAFCACTHGAFLGLFSIDASDKGSHPSRYIHNFNFFRSARVSASQVLSCTFLGSPAGPPACQLRPSSPKFVTFFEFVLISDSQIACALYPACKCCASSHVCAGVRVTLGKEIRAVVLALLSRSTPTSSSHARPPEQYGNFLIRCHSCSRSCRCRCCCMQCHRRRDSQAQDGRWYLTISTSTSLSRTAHSLQRLRNMAERSSPADAASYFRVPQA